MYGELFKWLLKSTGLVNRDCISFFCFRGRVLSMEWTFSGSIGIFEDSFFRGEGGENFTLFHISNIKNSSILMELSLYTIVKQPI